MVRIVLAGKQSSKVKAEELSNFIPDTSIVINSEPQAIVHYNIIKNTRMALVRLILSRSQDVSVRLSMKSVLSKNDGELINPA